MIHDHLTKELLTVFFRDFIEGFVPEAAAYVDGDFTLIPMDKEMFTDIAQGDAHRADLLMQARFKGQETCFLFHIEAESGATSGFPKRMYRYYAKIDLTYDLPVYPIALFTYDSPKREEPNIYEVVFPDTTVLKFQYKVIQLNRLSWRDFLKKPNPAACALMAQMNIAPEDRSKVKGECLRMLATMKLDPARSRLIGVYIDTYLKLNAQEMKELRREMEVWSREERTEAMELMTSWEIKGMKKGLRQGRQEGVLQGLHQGKEELVARQIQRRFGALSPAVAERLDRLSSDQLNDLGEALFDFANTADLETWLTRH